MVQCPKFWKKKNSLTKVVLTCETYNESNSHTRTRACATDHQSHNFLNCLGKESKEFFSIAGQISKLVSSNRRVCVIAIGHIQCINLIYLFIFCWKINLYYFSSVVFFVYRFFALVFLGWKVHKLTILQQCCTVWNEHTYLQQTLNTYRRGHCDVLHTHKCAL